MATLYKENTQYANPLAGGIPKINVPKTTIPKTETQKVSEPTKIAKTPSSYFSLSNAFSSPQGLSSEEKSAMTQAGSFRVGTSVNPPTETTENVITKLDDFLKKNQKELPGTYTFGQPLATPEVGKTESLWATPSEQAIVTTTPEGGQYITDPTQPGKIIRSIRGEWNPDENAIIRRGLNPAFYQIDHIIPLWAGGADSLTNREILRNDEHEIKTKAQAVPLTLLAYGLITPEEAMKEAVNWKGKSVSNIGNITNYNLGGMIPLDLAQKQSEAWKSGKDLASIDEQTTPSTTWNKFMNVISYVPQKAYKAASGFYHDVILGGGEEVPVTAIPKEFAKHFVSAIPFADILVPQLDQVSKYSDPALQTVANITAFGGRLAGDLAAFGATRALAVKALGKITGIGKYAAEAGTELSNLEKTQIAAQNALKGMGAAGKVTTRTIAQSAAGEALGAGAVMAALGQTHLQPVGEEDLEGRIKTMAFDTMYGTLLGTQGHSIRGYANVGALTAALGLMQGQTSQDSVLNSITMMAMHGLGHSGSKAIFNLAKEDPVYKAYIESRTAVEPPKKGIIGRAMKNVVSRSLYTPEVDVPMMEAAQRVVLKRFEGKMMENSISYRKELLGKEYSFSSDPIVLDRQNKLIYDKIDELAVKNEWNPEQIKRARLQADISGRELYKSGLSPEMKSQEDLKDIMSLGRHVLENKAFDPTIEGPKIVGKIKDNIDQAPLLTKIDPVEMNGDVLDAATPHGPVEVAGIHATENKPGIVKILETADSDRSSFIKTVDDFGRIAYDGRVLVVPEPEVEHIIRAANKRITPEQAKMGKVADLNPQNRWTVLIPYKDKAGELQFARLGGIASKERMTNMNTSNGAVEGSGRWVNPEANKDVLSNFAKKNNIQGFIAPARVIPKTERIAGEKIFEAGAQTGSPTSFAKIWLNDNVLKNSSKVINSALTKPSGVSNGDIIVMQKALEARPKEIPPVIESTSPEKAAKIAESKAISAKPEKVISPEEAEFDRMMSAPTITEGPKKLLLIKESDVNKVIPITNKEITEKVRGDILNTEVKPIEPEVKAPIGDKEENMTSLERAEKETSARAFTQLDENRMYKGPVLEIDKKIKELGGEDTEAGKKLVELKKNFSQDNLNDKIKEFASQYGSETIPRFEGDTRGDLKSVVELRKYIKDQFESNGIKSPTDDADINKIIAHLHYAVTESKPKQKFVINPLTETGEFQVTPMEFMSPADFKAEQYAKEHPEVTKDLSPIKYQEEKNTDRGISTSNQRMSARQIEYKMNENGMVYLGATGNRQETMWGVMWDKALAPGFDSINQPGAQDAFIKNYATKVLGLPEDISAADFVKRSPLFTTRNPRNPIRGEQWNMYILKSPSLDDLHIFTGKEKLTKNTSESALEEAKLKSAFDGKIYGSPETTQDISYLGGYIGKPRKRLKPVMTYDSPKGMVIQKGDWSEWDKFVLDYAEKATGKKMGPKDVITFEDNIKVGLGTAENKENYKFMNVPSESFTFKYSYPHEESNTLSFGSIISKFYNEDGINKSMDILYKPEIEKYKSFVKEISEITNSKDLDHILKKYDEYGKSEFLNNLYGRVKKMVSNGADVEAIKYNLDTMTKRVLQDYVLTGGFMKGDHLVLTPDFGVLNGKFLGPDETMISRRTFIKLYGKEAYDKLKAGETYNLISARYPVTRKTALTVSKIYIAEDYGIKNLGDEQIIPSLYDTYIRKEGDFDADAFTVFKIGDKDGIPQEMADAINKTRDSEGDMIMNKLNKYPSRELTLDNIREVSDGAMLGGDSVAVTSATNRIMPILKDTNFKMVLNPSVGGKRKVDIYFGNVKHQFDTPIKRAKTKMDQDVFSIEIKGDGQDTLVIKPKYGEKERQEMSQISQESTDSAKYRNLSDRLGKMKINNYLYELLFTNSSGGDAKKALKAFLTGDIQTPFIISNADRTIGSAFKDQMSRYIELTKSMSSGGNLGPVQTIMKNFEGFEPLPNIYKNPKEQWRLDKSGIDAVKNKFSGEFETINKEGKPIFNKDINTPAVKSFLKFFDKVKKGGGSPKTMREAIFNYFNEISPSLSQKEKDAISYWTVVSPKANLATKEGTTASGETWIEYNERNQSGYVNRIEEIFNDSPEIAKEYYTGRTGAYSKPEPEQAVVVMGGEPGQIEKKLAPDLINKEKSGIITTRTGVELKKETLPGGEFWLEQNKTKSSDFAKYAKLGHTVKWLMDRNGYVGPVNIDGKIYKDSSEARKIIDALKNRPETK